MSDPLEMCKNIFSAYILIFQPIISFIQCSLEVHNTNLTLTNDKSLCSSILTDLTDQNSSVFPNCQYFCGICRRQCHNEFNTVF